MFIMNADIFTLTKNWGIPDKRVTFINYSLPLYDIFLPLYVDFSHFKIQQVY